jgi:hypothetical protein
VVKQAVQIDSGPIEATDRLREVPKEKWHDLMLARRYFLTVHLSHDCRCLVEFVNDATVMYSALGFQNVEQMIREGYGLKPDEIAIAVRWLELNPPNEPLSLDQAITLGKQGRVDDAPRNEAGRYLPQAVNPKGSNTTIGRGRAYILARLDRDQKTELAIKVRNGKLSANAAAIEARYRKKPVKRCPKCGHEWS